MNQVRYSDTRFNLTIRVNEADFEKAKNYVENLRKGESEIKGANISQDCIYEITRQHGTGTINLSFNVAEKMKASDIIKTLTKDITDGKRASIESLSVSIPALKGFSCQYNDRDELANPGKPLFLAVDAAHKLGCGRVKEK